MELRYFAVIAVKECNKVFCQVSLIFLIQRAHNTKINGDVLRVIRMFAANKDISRMHVCMEEAIAENLRKKHLDATFSKDP